jgi:hypothetical protein
MDPDPIVLNEAALRIAMRWKQSADGEDCAAVVGACCWILAAMLRQGAHEEGIPITPALDAIMGQVWQCAGYLERVDLDVTTEEIRH